MKVRSLSIVLAAVLIPSVFAECTHTMEKYDVCGGFGPPQGLCLLGNPAQGNCNGKQKSGNPGWFFTKPNQSTYAVVAFGSYDDCYIECDCIVDPMNPSRCTDDPLSCVGVQPQLTMMSLDCEEKESNPY